MSAVMSRLSSQLAELSELTGALGRPVELVGSDELHSRSRELGTSTPGRTSANGSCWLLPASDSWFAVNLSRAEDVGAVPAVTCGGGGGRDPVEQLRQWAASVTAGEAAARCQLLGIPAAELNAPLVPASQSLALGESTAAGPGRVLNLTALWAGPLVAHVLARTGYDVLTLQDHRRPDGVRDASTAHAARLRVGQRLRRMDFSQAGALAAMAADADVVLEASRPRALRRLGLDAATWLRARPGRTWLSITGYGREDPAQRVAFGDDAAVAGGLVDYDDGGPVFCGDAIADPLTGIVAAAEVCRSQLAGGGHLLDVAMVGVSAHFAGR